MDITMLSNDMGFTLLHVAAYHSKLKICEALIDFVLNAQESEENPQLDEAEQQKEQSMRKRIL